MDLWVRRTPVFVKRFLRKATPANAVVRYLLPSSGEDGGPTFAAGEMHGELEITLGGHDAYTVKGTFNSHKKLAPFVVPGATLPVGVDPESPNKVAIRWDDYDGPRDGDRDEVAAANQNAYGAAKGEEAPSSGMSAGENATFDSSSWAAPYLAGLEEALKLGNISQEEYDQAKRDAGL